MQLGHLADKFQLVYHQFLPMLQVLGVVLEPESQCCGLIVVELNLDIPVDFLLLKLALLLGFLDGLQGRFLLLMEWALARKRGGTFGCGQFVSMGQILGLFLFLE